MLCTYKSEVENGISLLDYPELASHKKLQDWLMFSLCSTDFLGGQEKKNETGKGQVIGQEYGMF